MHARRPRKRGAFSLMEMMLSLAIAMVLLLALYLTLNAQFMHSNAGRDVVAEGALARNILAAIARDIQGQLAAADPRSLPDYASTPESVTVGPNLGVSGDATSLVLSGLRVQKPRVVAAGAAAKEPDMNPNADVGADLRRIAYWMVGNGGDTGGLARHETRQATATEIDIGLTELPDQQAKVIAKEVKKIQFEYHGGRDKDDWQTSWNGAEVIIIEDGTTLGPPAAIRITIWLRRTVPGASAEDNSDLGPGYTHVVALPASNNYPFPKK